MTTSIKAYLALVLCFVFCVLYICLKVESLTWLADAVERWLPQTNYYPIRDECGPSGNVPQIIAVIIINEFSR